jgi:hypothetical protein
MAWIFNCLAAAAAVPAVLASDDEWAVSLGLNAMVWCSLAMAVS